MTHHAAMVVDGTNMLRRCVAAAHPLAGELGPVRHFLTLLAEEASIVAVAAPAARGRSPDLAVAWDEGRSWRKLRWPWYKAHRQDPRHKAKDQVTFAMFNRCRTALVSVLQAAGVYQAWLPGLEADDVIRAACSGALRRSWWGDVAVLSSDADMAQLLAPRPAAGVRGASLWCRPGGPRWTAPDYAVAEGYQPALLPIVRALAGDKSDGIPGVKGIGPKRAVALLAAHGWDLGAVLDAARGGTLDRRGPWGSAAVTALADPAAAGTVLASWEASDLTLAAEDPGLAEPLVRRLVWDEGDPAASPMGTKHVAGSVGLAREAVAEAVRILWSEGR